MSKLDILSPTLDIDDVEVPEYLFLTAYIVDILSFPLLLVAVTYVLTWLRYKLERPATLTLLILLGMSFIRFVEQIILEDFH